MSGSVMDRLGLWSSVRFSVDVRVLRHSPFRFYRRREYGGVACVQIGRLMFMKVVR